MLQIELDLSYEVKPVWIVPPFIGGVALTHCALRPEFQFDGSCEQIAVMDARCYIPAGSALAMEGDDYVHVRSSDVVRGWH